MAAAPAAPPPAVCDPTQIGYLNAAVTGNRLIQAERMLGALRAGCAQHPQYLALSGQWALATGRFEQALATFSALAAQAPDNSDYLSAAGRAAFQAGRLVQALDLLNRATALPAADWRAWNALAVLHDRRRDWEASGRAYERALQLAPDQAAILNNRGYSLMLQGRAPEALPYLERAFALDANNEAIRRNRGMAQAMTGTFDDARRPRETTRDWAQRLNNMGYAAWLAGDQPAARRLLARAIEVSDTQFERAEANLARVEGRE